MLAAEQGKLVAGDGATSDGFGNAVALSGDTAIVGAFYDDVGANQNQGSAYVFLLGETCASMPDGTVCDDGNACTQTILVRMANASAQTCNALPKYVNNLNAILRRAFV